MFQRLFLRIETGGNATRKEGDDDADGEEEDEEEVVL